MILLYIYLAVALVVLGATLWSYRGQFDKFCGFWSVLKDCLILSILWIAFVPAGVLIYFKKRKYKNTLED